MPIRQSSAIWNGNLKEGKGTIKLGSGAFEGQYSFGTRFESGKGTNPEELIAAAHAGCFSMALSAGLGKAGITPDSIQTTAKVNLEKQGEGFAITRIDLVCDAKIPDIEPAVFKKHAEDAKANCPVSKALAGTKISLDARLLQPAGAER
jgi:lipoyl-dependent peroxiredoxin